MAIIIVGEAVRIQFKASDHNEHHVVVVKNLDGHLVWFENSGQPAKDKSWKRHVIDDRLRQHVHGQPIDMDGDGRPDVIATAEIGANELRWWRNAGSARETDAENQ